MAENRGEEGYGCAVTFLFTVFDVFTQFIILNSIIWLINASIETVLEIIGGLIEASANWSVYHRLHQRLEKYLTFSLPISSALVLFTIAIIWFFASSFLRNYCFFANKGKICTDPKINSILRATLLFLFLFGTFFYVIFFHSFIFRHNPYEVPAVILIALFVPAIYRWLLKAIFS
ncbi:MAG: hypothetical protein GXO48_03040 [Chlorobi bacterium]|nr:hypothetical protein [Chlorobiota bacterium]